MKLALVNDSPRDGPSATKTYVREAVASCAAAAGAVVETREFFAVDAAQPGAKAPPLALIRAQQPRLLAEIEAWGPDAVVSMGTSALKAMSAVGENLILKDERGRMRMLDLTTPWVPTVAPYYVVKPDSDLHRDFVADVYKAMVQRAPLEPMAVDTIVCRGLGDLERGVSLLEGASVVGVDVETTGLSAYRDELLCVGVGAVYADGGGVAVVVPAPLLSEAGVRDALWDAVWRRSRRSVGHNFKFDMQFLERAVGWPPEEALLGDTLLLAHLLDERPNRVSSRCRGLGLKDLVAVRYDHQYGFDGFGGEWTPERLEALYLYNGEDVCYTARLWLDLEREADEESLRLRECHDALLMPVSRALARCELAGAPVNVDWVRETLAVLDGRISRRRRRLELTLPRLALLIVVDNILSPTQIADVMYDEWGWTPDVRKHGRVERDDRSTDEDHMKAAIAKYAATQPHRTSWIRALISLRKDVKTRTTYQQSLLDRVDDDGRVRASFLMHGTATGRLSSQQPNLQNVPAVNRVGSEQRLPMRRAFKPRSGCKWVEVDYSQLELRVAAALSGDEAFAEVFRSGRDVHLEIASSIFGKPPEKIEKAERFLAKAVSFGILYGRSAIALANGQEMAYAKQELGMTPWTEDQAGVFTRKFLRSYPDLQAWIDRMHAEVPEQRYVESPFGRRRRFPLISSRELGNIRRQAVNTPVQSTASDICLKAMVEIAQRIETEQINATVLFPVHDSICIECGAEYLDRLEKICRDVMEQPFMGVPLTVDFEYGDDWASTAKHEPDLDRTSGSHESKGRATA